MKIVLFQPQIPQNTGNIIRTCSVTNTSLILIRPLGFSISQKKLKRAGLDYFKEVDIQEEDDLEEFLRKENKPYYFFSSKGNKNYTEINYERDALLIFGSETTGLPKHYYQKYKDMLYTIPMKKNTRCLNLSNSVAIVLYEGIKQQNFNF